MKREYVARVYIKKKDGLILKLENGLKKMNIHQEMVVVYHIGVEEKPYENAMQINWRLLSCIPLGRWTWK